MQASERMQESPQVRSESMPVAGPPGFHDFANVVQAQYAFLANHELYVVDTGEEDLFARYLAAFPPGTDPIYRTHTEHDCSCCKQFVRNLGRIVSIVEGQVRTIWPTAGLNEPYTTVSRELDRYVRSLPVATIFRTKERQYGTEVSRQLLDDGAVRRWHHFHGQVKAPHLTTVPEAARGVFNTTAQVFQRGLEELTPEAVAQVVELIESKALYRGEEHLPAVKQFQAVQARYLALPPGEARRLYVLEGALDPATRFRNTVIGTLVQDLSTGEDLERAVRSFEAKVAPTNYKRTTALITPRMVQEAMSTIRELGLETALERRLARLTDVAVTNVLWVDRIVKGKMKGGGVEELLLEHATDLVPSESAATDVAIEGFLEKILPTTDTLELFLRNSLAHNFMTLTAPVHKEVGQLFKWPNNFGWSYDGNITDSIREKVKAAGGDVSAKLRFSLAWYNYDDLDIHVKTPDENHYYFGNKGRVLDVDMNAGAGRTREPVENLSFTNPQEGWYEVWVNQYQRRETSDVGFDIEIFSEGVTTQLSYKKAVPQNANILVGKFLVKGGVIAQYGFAKGMEVGGMPQDKWGLKTERMHQVQTVLLSPNHWDGHAEGNRHVFFILKGCRTDGPARGIYNEFLASGLEKHRKVFEVLGEKTKCPVADEQLSGVGFSSTLSNKVQVWAKRGGRHQLFNIHF